jgi:hypothetical protein
MSASKARTRQFFHHAHLANLIRRASSTTEKIGEFESIFSGCPAGLSRLRFFNPLSDRIEPDRINVSI